MILPRLSPRQQALNKIDREKPLPDTGKQSPIRWNDNALSSPWGGRGLTNSDLMHTFHTW